MVWHDLDLRQRFTPAHAGNTTSSSSSVSIVKVHPRSRGEYVPVLLLQYLHQGSPPLTRGILGPILGTVGSARFTPAHAGNTQRYLPCLVRLKVHPRSRGEYQLLLFHLGIIIGSPPLTRGIRNKRRSGQADGRFTPAHAGNTGFDEPLLGSAQVHPRSRGEYASLMRIYPPSLGSPPLTRGIPRPVLNLGKERRFTPAHAGNTKLLLKQYLGQ